MKDIFKDGQCLICGSKAKLAKGIGWYCTNDNCETYDIFKPSAEKEKVTMRTAIADVYHEPADMGSVEFTKRYNQDCLKIKIVEKLYKEGYRKVQ